MKITKRDIQIYVFDYKKIATYGYHDLSNQIIVCSKKATELSYLLDTKEKKQRKSNCHMFDQIYKELGDNIDISEIIITIDFSSLEKNEYKSILRRFENGISLNINDKQIEFIDFLKSTSMNKKSRIYYINKEYYERINKRLTFNLIDNNEKVILAKWYAYSGLAVSDCHIMNDVEFNPEEVAIVPDLNRFIKTSCTTAISKIYLQKEFNNFKDYCKSNEKNINNLSEIQKSDVKHFIENISSFNNSEDFNNLPEELKNILIDLKNINFKMNIDDAIKLNNEITKKYFTKNETKEDCEWYKIRVDNYSIEVNAFDGEGLISEEFAKEINYKYLGHTEEIKTDDNYFMNNCTKSFQFRLPFLKGMLHTCDFKQFFKDHNITTIEGKTFNKNETRSYDVDKLKIIFTESQFKGAKYIKNLKTNEKETPLDAFFRLLKEYDYHFGFKVEPKRKKITTLNYQFLSTLPVSKFNFKKINELSIKELEKSTSEKAIIKSISNNNYYKLDELLYKYDPDFYKNTKKFKDIVNKKDKSLKNDFYRGKLYCYSMRKFLCSDLLYLLYHIAKIKINHDDELKRNEVYVPNTKFVTKNNPDKCLVLRNPHYSKSEIGLLKIINKDSSRDKYFKYLNGVAFINPYSLVAERVGGADYDGDEVILVYQKDIVYNVSKNIMTIKNNNGKKEHLMKYPIIKIPSLQANPTTVAYENKVNHFSDTFCNLVGKISNLAFNNALENYSSNDDEDINAIYTILGGLEIDSAKNGKHPNLLKYNVKKNKLAENFLKMKDCKEEEKYSKDDKEDFSKCKKDLLNTKYENNLSEQLLYKSLKNIDKLPSPSKKEKNKYIYQFVGNSSLEGQLNVIKILLLLKILDSKQSRLYRYVEIEKEMKIIIHNILRINYGIYKYKSNGDNGVLEFLQEFETQNNIEMLKKYNQDSKVFNDVIPFHFMSSRKEKEKYLIDLGFNNISDQAKNIICDFHNKGFAILFNILLYWNKFQYLNSEILNINSNKENIDKSYDIDEEKLFGKKEKTNTYNVLESLNLTIEELLSELYEYEINFFDLYLKDFDFSEIKKPNTRRETIYKYIKELPINNGITLDDINKIMGTKMFDNNYIFTIFSDQLLDYIKK